MGRTVGAAFAAITTLAMGSAVSADDPVQSAVARVNNVDDADFDGALAAFDEPSIVPWIVGAGAAALVAVVVVGALVASSGPEQGRTALGGPEVAL